LARLHFVLRIFSRRQRRGLGASHQTGWTGLIGKLLQQIGEYAVLMDISLPIVDGLTTAKAIREIEGSGEGTDSRRSRRLANLIQDKAIEAGCNELIFKPIDFDVLRLLIEK
jgi:CheY-like chemotaxis protein